ncbi:MAG: helix-turn-helix transcriptional regulator [Alphaproteobacteria bacterium]|nr:helix-turn-helix transcriptional regulator [Alphaproteobacteria bacterium]MBP9776753.1 helix-turn-helix transcriptional regulator [Alphaproteobacteria bacterium]
MSTSIAKHISTRMRAKNLTLTALEKEAGLKPSAVQNILRGRSKRPSADILQAVADVLGCSVKELLTQQETSYEEDLAQSNTKLLSREYEHPELFSEIVNFVNNALKNKENKLTIEQFMSCIQEIYLHSLQKDPNHMDEEFAEWWIDLATD